MKQFNVSGMSCAACSARVEKAVSKVPGVTACSVSLLTNSMGVEGSASDRDIIDAVTAAGYGASPKNSAAPKSNPLEDQETPLMAKRLIASLIFLIPLLYCSMGHMLWGWPLPQFIRDNPVNMGLIQLLLTSIIMVINQRFFISGTKAALHLAPNMDTLVSLGAGASFVYSLWTLFIITSGKADASSHYFYFESTAMILTLITVGKMLEARSKGKTTDAIKGLMQLTPKTAVILDAESSNEKTVPIEVLKTGDIFVVRPGENIPVDGIIIEGNAAINEAALTGESIPADKGPGDTVSAATTNLSGFIKCRASRVGQDTTLSQIIQLVSDAAASKAPIAKIADKVSGIFVPLVILTSIITLIIWLISGADAERAIMHAIAVLVISCPCALGLATPVAIMVGNGIGARNGILFKTAAALEEAGKIQIAALDKTGTITSGQPLVTDIIPFAAVKDKELLQAALNLEAKSEHPLAKAIIQKAKEDSLIAEETQDFTINPGQGLMAKTVSDGRLLCGGNLDFIKKQLAESPEQELFLEKSQSLSAQGKTPLFFARDKELLGIIAVADTIREDSAQAIKELKALGLKPVMLTGDNENTARAIAAEAGINQVMADLLPADKAQAINSLKAQGKVCMVGDGINDAPSLTSADLGIAIGAGSDIAIDAADIILVKNSLKELPALIRLSRATVRNIHQNLFWAFFYNAIGIPLAAGAFVRLFGWHLNPSFGAAAMSLSSFCVVTNALRLNMFKLYKTRHVKAVSAAAEDIRDTRNIKESKMEEKTILIEGMMCEHCEAHVKKALEALPGIESAQASHKDKEAIIKTSSPVSEESIKQAITAAGYDFIGIK